MTVAQKLWGMRGLALLIVVAMVLAACGAPAGAPAAEAPAEEAAAPAEDAGPAGGRGAGDTVNLIYWQAVSILNPYLSGGTKDIEGASVVLEPLAHYDENGVLVPFLAEEIPTVENGGVSEDSDVHHLEAQGRHPVVGRHAADVRGRGVHGRVLHERGDGL